MGHFYETPDGQKLPGVGVFDLYTEPRKPDEERLIGNADPSARPEDEEMRGRRPRTTAAAPTSATAWSLGEVVVGFGNNGKDGTEGARRLNACGTYLHGSLLPKNPWLTDQLILNALRRVTTTSSWSPSTTPRRDRLRVRRGADSRATNRLRS